MNISQDTKLDFSDVLLTPAWSINASRSDVNMRREFDGFYHSSRKWSGLPVMIANMDTTGTLEMWEHVAGWGSIVCFDKRKSLDYWKELLTDRYVSEAPAFQKELMDTAWVSTGITDADMKSLSHIKEICEYKQDFDPQNRRIPPIHPSICIDVANGYSQYFVEKVECIRKLFPESIIMAGNVVTPEMVLKLIHAGADIVKIGIGPGSVCTTRLKTGVGYPQFSAVVECANAAHGIKNPENGRVGRICADGGCTSTGDICKALGAGADFVMIGGMVAGTDQCNGKWSTDISVGKKVFQFYGMSSYEAQDKYDSRKKQRTSEGKLVEIPAKGCVENVMQDIVGGIRSCCAYIGATSIKDIHRCANFVRVNNTHNKIFGG